MFLLGHKATWVTKLLSGLWKNLEGIRSFRPTPKAMAWVALGPYTPLTNNNARTRCILISMITPTYRVSV
jgi:hypothetical protein